MSKIYQSSTEQIFESEDSIVEQKSNVSETQSIEKAKTITKKKYKKKRFPEPPQYGEYIITPIYKNNYNESNEIYFSGDIIVDFSKINKPYEDLYSPWNQYKNINSSAIDPINRLLITKLEDKAFDPNNQEIYPDQTVQDLIKNLITIAQLQGEYKAFLKEIMQHDVVQNHLKIYHRFMMHEKFQQKAYAHYKRLGKNAKFMARHFGPEPSKNRIESLLELLGQSIEESQSKQHRFGLFDFFEFETISVIQKRVLQSVLEKFHNPNLLPGEYLEETEPINLKFIAYDEISFYANVRIQTLSFTSWNDDLKLFSLYFSMIFILDISPGMEKQLRIQRQKLQEMGVKPLKYQEDITYTIQAEIFHEKFIQNKQGNNSNKDNDFERICGFKSL